jgi:endonuclease-3
VLEKTPNELKSIIKPAGLAEQKAPRIISIINKIKQEKGTANLNFLKDLTADEAEAYLLLLPGVGKKAARCILMYSLHADVFPVDTHILRIFKRIGLVSSNFNRKKAQDLFQDMVPANLRYSLHVNLVLHGRTVCTTKKPHCEECPLSCLCASYPNGPFYGVTP